MQRLCSIVLAALLVPVDAHADWQFTKWGMTPDEVHAASSGTVLRMDAKTAKGRCLRV